MSMSSSLSKDKSSGKMCVDVMQRFQVSDAAPERGRSYQHGADCKRVKCLECHSSSLFNVCLNLCTCVALISTFYCCYV